jgi:hypothetical protein
MAESIERKYMFAIKVGADDLDELERAVDGVLREIRRQGEQNYSVISGGVGSGYIAALKVNPDQTHDGYIEAIQKEVQEWMETQE